LKTTVLVAAIVICALSAPIVSAQDKSAPAKPAMSMEMDKRMPQMQENMKNMQHQMEKLRATTDPKERKKLMQEHMQAMQANMEMMRSMSGPMMMGGKKEGMTDADMMKRHEMMEKRMDMMQMMMEQMMQHDQMTEAMPAK